MIVYPAIDLKQGRCVRLLQGRMQDATVYGEDPAAMARRWASGGAQALHVVDLDGAFDGAGRNIDAVRAIARAVDIPVQLGGGIRSMEDIHFRLEDVGVAKVILGTVAVEQPALVREACARYPGRIIAGIDAKDGFVAVRGWVQQGTVRPLDLALDMREAGVDTVIYTDISRDGMLVGANVEATARLVQGTGMRVIASGGIGSLADIARIKEAGCAGVIVGKALYAGAVTLADALALQ
nr:1-(5-phosphoribosyl)-5-[(5-phosphoribosylamino)methylideneamino]imidazole-4-carboxamide isomerase [Maliibacterium massiliense]